jgi:putative transposase
MSLAISEVGLIIKEKVLKPFWTPACQVQSDKLWLPIKTDCVGLVSTWSNTLSSHLVEKSWFSTTLQVPRLKKWSKTSPVSYMSSLPVYTDLENTNNKLKTNTIIPQQKSKNCKILDCKNNISLETNKFFCNEHYENDINNINCRGITSSKKNNKKCPYKATTNGFCGHHKLNTEPVVQKEYNHSRMIRINTTPEQLIVYRQIFGVSRKMYNEGVSALRNKETTLSEVRDFITDKFDTLDYCKNVPLKIKQGALEDLQKATSNCYKKWKKTNKPQKCKFKNKYAASQSIYMNFDAIKKVNDNSFYFYIQAIGKYFDKNEDGLLKVSEKLPNITTHCRLVLRHKKYLYISIPMERPEYNIEPIIKSMVAIDQGERNNVAFYSHNITGLIGSHTRDRYSKLFTESDFLKSKIQKLKNKVKKCKGVIKQSIKHLIKKLHKKFLSVVTKPARITKELHDKTALFLCKNFEIIAIPEYSCKKVAKNLSSVINRSNQALSQYTFRQRLIHKAKQYKRTVHIVPEDYTSKTCTKCGYCNESKTVEYLTCSNCKITLNRDFIGARNIFLKTLMYFNK